MFRARTILASTFAIGLAGAAVGCSTFKSEPASDTFPMSSAEKAPAAKGTVAVTPSSTGNNTVKISVEHLAPPYRVRSDANTYVAWLTPLESNGKPAHQEAINLGTLQVNDQESASLSTSTPFNRFEITVTPEADAAITQPTGDPVLRTQVHGQ